VHEAYPSHEHTCSVSVDRVDASPIASCGTAGSLSSVMLQDLRLLKMWWVNVEEEQMANSKSSLEEVMVAKPEEEC
jgi:hypothetical protein